MNFKIFNFLRKSKPPTGLQEPASQVLEEIKDLRKHLRKQKFLLESFKNDIIKAIVDDRRPGIDPYCDVADAFFYYEAALQSNDHVSPEQLEALKIIWDKIDNLMSLVGLQIMRRAGGDFDAKIYEAIENRADGAAELIILQVLQPGYIFKNMVLKPAKVVVGKKNHHSEG
ncbi:MAG: nucleotide exchange factor GrpE [Proteobacteria bacterium]|nr:nucleotide exchange factor GrpE [Pseudomonadota bacterium]MBU4449440.1 nucleotide exchange factor GrpE [Pseudomonadota bacterium]MCG2772136.1 nucleotide exchange factor GrpE [Desulfobacterales bacterium]